MSHSYLLPFRVLRRDGSTRLFYTAVDAWKHLCLRPRDVIGVNFSNPWREYAAPRRFIHFGAPVIDVVVDVVVQDDAGKPVPPAWLRSEYEKAFPHRFRRGSWNEQKDHAATLGLPIPGTGKRRWRGGWLRRPSHIGMYRANEDLAEQVKDAMEDEEGWGNMVRRSLCTSNEHHPPNAWDDFCRADIKERNWKANRRTRWR